ncbi:cytochrome c oxidase subunit II [Marinigracilibium pacificum]|uniref:Cytochrome c oxidase subunit 2 n=1 Tax=Marinigracilibium pacificum TaxID=2729599 RepID=A0A848J4C2_9BACT|nr:cytochrome c oxidase subunit II [Marinigracilibium pacificum]NMM50158.1 cytochrome c oxidase subunit II [Marinigracilibium pacificum]
MVNTLIILGAILILVILVTVFRVITLVDVAKGSDKKRASGSNTTNALLWPIFGILFFGSIFYYSFAAYEDYKLPVASIHGVETDELFWITMIVTGIVFILTHILLFWYSWKYKFGENKKALFYPDNTKLELAWTVVPAIALTVLILSGLFVWNDITDEAPEDAINIEVMGYQFAWGVRYPGADGELGDYNYQLIDQINAFGVNFNDKAALDDFTPIKLVIPKDTPINLNIRARDVLHSVFLPHFRVKMDAVPGMPTNFHFVATHTTEEMRNETKNPDFKYEMACTEICGRGHFSMRMEVEVLTKEEYKKWASEQKTWVNMNQDYFTEGQGKKFNLPSLADKSQEKEEKLSVNAAL